MYTFQDLVELGDNERERKQFVLDVITAHRNTEEYKTARDAELYFQQENPTIMNFQKFVYNQFGKAVPDVWVANNKIPSNWYFYFVTQAIQYLLGNGVSFSNEATKDKLGKNFDKVIQQLATFAKHGGKSFGFWNYDHVEVFALTEFAPLYDEESGGLSAGVRFWQIDSSKPLRATLFEIDGYTDYIKRNDEDIVILHEKRKYVERTSRSEATGEQILDGYNYPSFPIVPMFNINRASELTGKRNTIDAYDLTISGLVNNISDGEFLYWVIKNYGGMDDADIAKFIEQLKFTHVAPINGDETTAVDAHKVEAPFEGNEATLDRLRKQLYDDFMGLDVSVISAGSVTATQIVAAYEPLNQKTDLFEYQVTEFIEAILELAGIDDTPTYTRSMMANQGETITNVLQAAEYLDDEYITRKILTVLGDIDQIEALQQRKAADGFNRFDEEGDEEE